MGLRAKATAMPVPNSSFSVARRADRDGQERVVVRLGRPDAVVAALPRP